MAKINSDAYFFTTDATWGSAITFSPSAKTELEIRNDYWDYARDRKSTNMEWLDRRIQEIRDCWKTG